MSRRRTWFLPSTPDVIGMLRQQAAVTRAGMAAFTAWAGGDIAREADVRDAEHAADAARRTLVEAVRDAFTTPLPQEDLFEISQGLDEVLNAAKDTVREAGLMGVLPDQAMEDMARLLQRGVDELDHAFSHLGGDTRLATAAADLAIKQQRRLERVYRTAMSELIEVRDLHEVLARQELYRRMTHISDRVVHVAKRVWYASVKES